jgi:hypothetical protein
MCTKIGKAARGPSHPARRLNPHSYAGVDPLASNKGFWGKLLGVGDFYYELAVQVGRSCLSYTRRMLLTCS